MQVWKFRTVTEEQAFIEDLEALQEKYPNIYSVKDGVCWELCRRPEAGTLLQNENHIRVFNTFPIGNAIRFRVLYKYNEDYDPRVFLLSISPVNEEEE